MILLDVLWLLGLRGAVTGGQDISQEVKIFQHQMIPSSWVCSASKRPIK